MEVIFLNLQQLYYFKTIAELEHYTRASEILSISQSSLSHAIQSLESELNVKLFTRRGRNVALTKYGHMLLPYVDQSLATLERGIAKLNDYVNPNTGTVTIACSPSLAQFVPDIFVRYISETGRVDIHLQTNQEASYYTLREHLLDGKIDLVFATQMNDPRISGTQVGEHGLVLLVPLTHRFAARESIDLRELDGEDFIAYTSDSQLRQQYDSIFSNLGVKPKITSETSQDLIIYSLVSAGRGVAVTPRPLISPYNAKIVHIENNIPNRPLYLLWNNEEYLPSAAEHFRNFIIKKGFVFNEYISRNHLD